MVREHYLPILISLIIVASAIASAQGGYSVSKEGLNFIAEHEGILYNLYNDPAGHCTIGIGHLVHKGNCDGSDTSEQEFLGGITRDQAFELLKSDVAIAEQAVNTYVTVPLTQAQFDALVSFTYNLGVGNFKKSDLLKKLNAGQYDAVPQELNKWVYGGGKVLPGLVTRRSDEGTLFQSEGLASGASKQVTLTLYVHDGSASGPIIAGAKVTGQDASGNGFQQTTDRSGYVTITGDPGTWSFSASEEGYETNSWNQKIAASDTKHALLQKLVRINKTSTKVTLTLYVHEESLSGPVISDVQVNAVDEHQLNQNVTDENGMTIVTGVPGTWDFRLGAKGYYAKSWSDEISNDNTKHVFLQKLPRIKVTIYVHEGSINGPIIPGAKVNCWACTEIEQLTDGNGCAVFSMIVPESPSNHIDAYGIVKASGYEEGPWRFNDLTEAITKRIVLQKERESVTPTETSETSSKYSKNSIVGKWKIQRDMHCDGHFAKDMMSITTFNEDGTALYEDDTGSDPSYMWKQSGNTVSWSPLQTSIYQGDVGDKHQLTTYPLFHEGTIDEDTMSGTWTTHGSPNPDGEATGCWKAVRVG
jgi:lysozyme